MPSQPPQAVQGIFNQIAPVYDQLNDRLSLKQHWIWKQMAVNWSGAKTGDRCLDICCGSGDISQLLAKQVGPTGQITGLDFSSDQLLNAKQRVQGVAWGDRISWIEGDALALPFEAETFDAVTMGYGLRNVDDIPKALGEILRMLKPGRTAAILDFCHSDFPPVAEAQKLYLRHLVVPAARQLGCEAEYAYIEDSIEMFPTGQEQVDIAREVGFSQAVYYLTALGMMGVLVLQKD